MSGDRPRQLKLKSIARLVSDKAGDAQWKLGLENIEGWTGRLSTEDGDFEGDGIAFQRGDVLFGKLRPYLAKAWVADREGAAVGDFIVMRPSHDLVPEFLLWTILSPERIDEITSTVYGAKMPRASWGDIRELELDLPSVETQRSILSYLERETAEIDAFIADQEELIALLTERRAATITHAVTKGLDPTSPMARDEDWYSWRPESWQVQKLAWLFTTIGSGTTPPHDSNDYYNGEIPWVTTGELREAQILETSASVSDRAVAELSALKIYPQDSLVIAMYGATIGRLGFLGVPATGLPHG